MKNYISKATLALLVALSATGCSDFLDEKLKSELAPDNTYTSSYGFEVGSTGLYAEARSEYNTWGENGAFMHNAACPYEALQIATDLATMGTKDGSIQPFGFLTLTPNTGIVGSYWNWAYSLIAGANEMLKYSEINTNWDNSTDKALYQAESRFFRAYAYRTLVYLYGDVPYVDKIQDQFRIDFTRTPKEEVIAHMVEDLQFAVENLPTDPDAVKVGKLTKWAAEHLLSEVYLMQGDYAKAETAAENVINSGYFHLMEDRFGEKAKANGDVFSDLFVENNQNRIGVFSDYKNLRITNQRRDNGKIIVSKVADIHGSVGSHRLCTHKKCVAIRRLLFYELASDGSGRAALVCNGNRLS